MADCNFLRNKDYIASSEGIAGRRQFVGVNDLIRIGIAISACHRIDRVPTFDRVIGRVRDEGGISGEGVTSGRDLEHRASLDNAIVVESIHRQQFLRVDIETTSDAVRIFTQLQGVGGGFARG